MHLERNLHDSICRDESLHDDHAVTDNDSFRNERRRVAGGCQPEQSAFRDAGRRFSKMA